MTTPEDDDLLIRIHSGDETAFVSLYRTRHGAIFRFALHMTGSRAAAEDITQDVFLAVIHDRCAYTPERGSLSGYLFGIARKQVLRRLERDRADSEMDAFDDLAVDCAGSDPLLELTRQESLDALRRAVDALPRRYREVVVLCDLEEVDYADAADALGCPIGTVRSRLHRARALLLEKLTQKRHPQRPPTVQKSAEISYEFAQVFNTPKRV